MYFNFANLQQLALTLAATLVTTTVFVTAAVGPVGQFV